MVPVLTGVVRPGCWLCLCLGDPPGSGGGPSLRGRRAGRVLQVSLSYEEESLIKISMSNRCGLMIKLGGTSREDLTEPCVKHWNDVPASQLSR